MNVVLPGKFMNLLVLINRQYKAERLTALESNLNTQPERDTERLRSKTTTEKTLKMLSLHGFQPSLLTPFMRIHWPVCSLWTEIKPLYRHTDLLQEMEKLQHKISEEIQQMSNSEEIQPLTCTVHEKEGSGFALILDTKDFSPEELSVKQVGRKLQVSGKTEKKQEDGKDSYSYRIQELRRVFDLPEGVNPETVTCSMTDGKLYIQASVNQISETPERMLHIHCPQTVKTTQTETEKIQNNTTETHTTDQQS
ncbi:heat shock protein 30-like [Misgurnus anguillicaudatus]|uniref:heat shock protein 30-like n=1 Tax=Misgurnus anguillicaudatus TaxID=75329 RepID=UPI003CCFCA7B